MKIFDRLFSLEGRVAFVTGASSGLGARFARVLAAAGARVVCAARRVERLEALEAEINAEFPGRAWACSLDVTDEAASGVLLEEVAARWGEVDLLVNNAGIAAEPAFFQDLPRDDWNATLTVNVDAPMRLSQEVANRLIAAGQGGSIIHIASVLGLSGGRRMAEYAVSKGALIQLTRCMAVDLAEHGIRVNAIAPGAFETEMMTGEFFADEEGQELIRHVAFGRPGQPDELDGVLLLLAGNAASYMSGSVVVVDGGYTAESAGFV